MTIIVTLITISFIYFGLPLVHRIIVIKLLKSKAVKLNSLALTFDDGPDTKLTPELLKTLAQNNIKVTFFLLGKSIEGKEDMVREIVKQGHEICSHGYDHLNYCKISPFKAVSDINKGWQMIDTALGAKNNKYPFRPPYGRLEFFSLMYLLFSGVPIVYWSIDSGDTWKNLPELDRVSQLIEKNGGGVCLLHNFERKVAENNYYVLDATKAIINTAEENGMSLLTISELLADKKQGLKCK